MNIKIADRLVDLRKKNGYSQEQLAEKLGLSRQAVSKWERAEASPDTDNLICLAKLYNISLDELLNSDETIDEIAKETKEKQKENITINGNEVHVTSKDGTTVHIKTKDEEDDDEEEKEIKPTKKNELISAILNGVCVLGSLIAYFILSFRTLGFAKYWPIIIIAISLPTIYDAIYKKKFCAFAYPLFVAGVYCLLGTFLNLWHPYWFVFLTIPLFYIIFSPIDKLIRKQY